MDKNLQDLAWSILPKEFKEEVKKLYIETEIELSKKKGATDNLTQQLRGMNRQLAYLFGIHNLTSDAEGEEMLMVSAITVREMYAANERIKTDATDKELGRTSDHINHVLHCLFGSKCLPDKKIDSKRLVNIIKDSMENPLPDKMLLDGTIEPKPAEPKYHKGEKVCYNGYVYEVGGLVGKNRYAIKGLNFDLDEDMIEPYTEPEKNIAENRNLSKDCDKEFDRILKDSFSKERRLNIAARMMQGLICAPIIPGIDPNPPAEYLAQTAFRLADALIAEWRKD